jgi:CBS domain-containing protein
VRDILARKGSQVYSVGPDDSVFEALERMAEHDVGALAVRNGDALVGIVSEREYARKVILLGRASRDTRVREVMRAPEPTVAVDDTVQTCMNLVTEHRYRYLPVVTDGDTLVGMVSIGDLVKAILDEQAFEIEQLNNYIAGRVPTDS